MRRLRAEEPQRTLAQGLDRLNSEFGRGEHGLTLRLSDRWFNDKLKLELGAIFDLTHDASLWRPRASYSASDQVKFTLGIDYFSGPQQSFFGARRANRLGFAEVAFVF